MASFLVIREISIILGSCGIASVAELAFVLSEPEGAKMNR